MNTTKKQRGVKRYYKKLEFRNDFEKSKVLQLNCRNGWFDKWHIHFDLKGYGNNSFRSRKLHLDKLFRHFDLLAGIVQKIKIEYQVYVVLLDRDSSSDALFIHTPNPNNSPFPFTLDSLSNVSTLSNIALNNYLHHLDGYEKKYGKADEAFCVLYKKQVGEPLW